MGGKEGRDDLFSLLLV